MISALNYFDEKGAIELQTKPITDVYQVFPGNQPVQQLTEQLFARFAEKEQSEIKRIHHLLAFFTSNSCLSRQLALYFSDHQLQQGCGHCSVCAGQTTVFPPTLPLKPLEEHDFTVLCAPFIEKLAGDCTTTLISQFLCGIATADVYPLKSTSTQRFFPIRAIPLCLSKKLDRAALQSRLKPKSWAC